MHEPDLHPAAGGFSAGEFVRTSGWVHPHHDSELLLSAAEVVAELLRWCHHASLISPDRLFGDAERTVATVEAFRHASASARQLFAHLAAHVDPHPPGDEARVPESELRSAVSQAAVDSGAPQAESATTIDELAELSRMAAAEHFRNAALMAEGSFGFLGRASEYMERQGQPPDQ